MAVLQRVSDETRRRTGWLVPMGIATAIGWFTPDTERVLEQSERFWTGGMIAAGVVFLLPGEWSSRGSAVGLWFPIGVVAGLVLMTSRQDKRAGDRGAEEQAPGAGVA
ncbi:hypothetical protein ABZX12_31505 [Kribbella sp. NPDC003505]|uniref:hypothetical protein n=1 Tax=Kribbella sp. NPDC003505 TaxID=3154448 RepID=UPI0033BDF29E